MNSLQRNLRNTVTGWVWKDFSPHHIHLNKMVWWRDEIKRSWWWLAVCSKSWMSQQCSGRGGHDSGVSAESFSDEEPGRQNTVCSLAQQETEGATFEYAWVSRSRQDSASSCDETRWSQHHHGFHWLWTRDQGIQMLWSKDKTSACLDIVFDEDKC